jgi:type IV pilus assembly protein PilF
MIKGTGMDKNFLKIILSMLIIFIMSCSSNQSPPKYSNLMDSQIDYKKAALLNVDLGRSYLAQGYTERAKKKFIHALELMPTLPEAHSGMGYFWEAVKEYKEAETHYRTSISLGKGKGLFYNQYAIFLCERGRYKEANKNFILAIKDKFYEQTAEVYNNAGLCSLKHADQKQAEEYFTKALHHDPKRIYLLLDLAKIALKQHEFNIADNYLKQFYRANNKPTAEYLLLSIKVDKFLGQEDMAASKALVLKNLFPDSSEYIVYQNEYGQG